MIPVVLVGCCHGLMTLYLFNETSGQHAPPKGFPLYLRDYYLFGLGFPSFSIEQGSCVAVVGQKRRGCQSRNDPALDQPRPKDKCHLDKVVITIWSKKTLAAESD